MAQDEEIIDPGMIIGVFLSFFGGFVLVAIAFTPTFQGKITNLICGLAIITVSSCFIAVSRRGLSERKQQLSLVAVNNLV